VKQYFDVDVGYVGHKAQRKNSVFTLNKNTNFKIPNLRQT